MSIGYSLRLHRVNKQANGKLLGVKLGRYCIQNGVAVAEVVKHFNVSRQTVYNWFAGEGSPKGKNYEAIKKYLASVS